MIRILLFSAILLLVTLLITNTVDGKNLGIIATVTNCSKVEEVPAGETSFLEYLANEQKYADVALVVQQGVMITEHPGPYPPHFFKVLEILKSSAQMGSHINDEVGFHVDQESCRQMQVLEEGTYVLTMKSEMKDDKVKMVGKIFHRSAAGAKFLHIQFNFKV